MTSYGICVKIPQLINSLHKNMFFQLNQKVGVDSLDDKLWNLCQNSSVDKFSAQKYVFSTKSKSIDSYFGGMTFQIPDITPLLNFVHHFWSGASLL